MLPQRCVDRNVVMYNKKLTLRARMLYYLIDDKANENREVWWHWEKLSLLLGVGRSQYFAAVKELKNAGAITLRHEGNLIYYKIQTVRKIGLPVRKIGIDSPENRTLADPYLITETVHEAELPPIVPQGGRRNYACALCRDRGVRAGRECPRCADRRHGEELAQRKIDIALMPEIPIPDLAEELPEVKKVLKCSACYDTGKACIGPDRGGECMRCEARIRVRRAKQEAWKRSA